MKYLKNALFLIFLFAVFMAKAGYEYHHSASLNGFFERIIYAGAFACFMICAGFRKSPLSLAAILLTSAAATCADSSFAFLFFPVYVNLFFIIKSFEKHSAREIMLDSSVFSGILLSSPLCAAYRYYAFNGNHLYTKDDSSCRLPFIIIISVCVGLTALFALLISRLIEKGAIKAESPSLFRQFALSYLSTPDEKTTYKKNRQNKTRRLSFIKPAYMMNILVFAFGFYYFSRNMYYGPKAIIFVLHWAALCAAIICRELNFDFPGRISSYYKRITQ